jgi:acetyl-CoA carboxylase biotin carboxyl carrier protein
MQNEFNDIKRILRIIEESEYEEVEIHIGDLKIRASKHGVTPSAASGGIAASAAPANLVPVVKPPPEQQGAAETVAIPEGLAVVYAPMVGTAYRAPSPDAPPYCEIGTRLAAEDSVCLIEIMKLFYSISADVSGTVKDILFEDGALVAYNQPLILIEPD